MLLYSEKNISVYFQRKYPRTKWNDLTIISHNFVYTNKKAMLTLAFGTLTELSSNECYAIKNAVNNWLDARLKSEPELFNLVFTVLTLAPSVK